MDTIVLLLGIMTASMLGVTADAWHLGNERRDVALLGAVGGLCGVGTVAAAFSEDLVMDTLLPFLAIDFLGKPTWVWLVFIGVVVTLLAFDLGVLHKDDHEIGVRESLLLSSGYISVALMFGAWVWWYLGAQSGMAYYTGFMIEKSLSMDNVFVIALIFTFFAIPRQYQHRVLFWGILGVIVLLSLIHI